MKKFLLVIMCLSLLVSAASASLLNPADQVNKNNAALGGNAAVRAYNKASSVEVGMSLMNKFSQNTTILSTREQQVPAYKGSNVEPAIMTNQFVRYNTQVGGGWLGAGYGNDIDFVRSFKMSGDKDTNPNGGSQTTLQYGGVEAIDLSYAMDLNKDLVVGATLASNRYFETRKQKNDKKYGGASTREWYYSSAPYLSVALGGIYKLSKDSNVLASYKRTNPRNISGTGANTYFSTKFKYDEQWTEEMQDEIALGYTQKLSNILEVGGTMKMYPTKQYVSVQSRNNPTTELDLTKEGYTAYTLNGEYGLMKDLALQGYFGWAKNTGRVLDATEKTDTGNDHATLVDQTEMGISAVYTMGQHTIIGGLARNNSATKWDPDSADLREVTDLTKAYVNYAYAF